VRSFTLKVRYISPLSACLGWGFPISTSGKVRQFVAAGASYFLGIFAEIDTNQSNWLAMISEYNPEKNRSNTKAAIHSYIWLRG